MITRREALKGAAAALAAATIPRVLPARAERPTADARLVLRNGRIATMDRAAPSAEAVAVAPDGTVLAVGSNAQVEAVRGPGTEVVDLGGRTVIPGLNDSHTHVIRGGLYWDMELRWEGVRSVADALELLRLQALRTPPPHWVRVVGGWSEFQFRERRMPTLDELNRAAPDTPVFVLHLYDRALLNRAALRALGYDENPPAFDRGVVERDERGRPTGMLVAKPSALILYGTLARAPRLSPDAQAISTRRFLRELNRLGVTSVIDAGGGGQAFPDDYAVVRGLAARKELTVRIGYDLFAQKAGAELDDYRRWVGMTKPGDGDAFLQTVGAGENLTWAAADFENFREPRPDLPASMESELEAIVRLLASHRWPFRIHATYDESIGRFLSIFEKVHRDLPFGGLHWLVDHAETISDRNIERVRALGGGIAVQHRMAFQGEYFVERYGKDAVQRTPPIRRMLELGVPVGAGTDATRVASYNPWVSLYWLVSGRTLGGLRMYPDANRLERTEALRLWTAGSAWFSSEEDRKGTIAPGRYADLAVLSKDFFAVPEDEIKDIVALLTVVGGRVVHAADEFARLAPPAVPAAPEWSPARAERGTASSGESAALAWRQQGDVHGHGGPVDFGLGPHGCACWV